VRVVFGNEERARAKRTGATGNDVNSAGNLSLSSFLFLFRQERAGRKRKEKEERRKIPEVTSLPVAP
jgi:hypothetical protein